MKSILEAGAEGAESSTAEVQGLWLVVLVAEAHQFRQMLQGENTFDDGQPVSRASCLASAAEWRLVVGDRPRHSLHSLKG